MFLCIWRPIELVSGGEATKRPAEQMPPMMGMMMPAGMPPPAMQPGMQPPVAHPPPRPGPPPPQKGGSETPHKILFLQNLPQETTEMMLTMLFEQ